MIYFINLKCELRMMFYFLNEKLFIACFQLGSEVLEPVEFVQWCIST